MKKTKYGPKHLLSPQPAILAGANVGGKPNYLTIAWCGIIQASPALIYISLRRERFTLPGIRENGTFSVNVPSTSQAEITDFCGITSGRNFDKSEIFTNFYGELETAPMIEECPVNMECRLIKEIDFEGTHIVFVGKIIQTWVSDDCMTDGKPDVAKIDPLIFTTSMDYWGLGKHAGKSHNIGRNFKPE